MAFGYVTPYRRPLGRSTGNWGSDMLSDLNTQINRLFDDFFDDDDSDESRRFASSRKTSPLMDISKQDKSYRMEFELPGVKKSDIDLTIDEGVLTIVGEKKRRFRDGDDSWTERSYGKFERRIALPKHIDEEKVEADFEDGVLMISLPLKEKSERGRRIELGGFTADENRLIDEGRRYPWAK